MRCCPEHPRTAIPAIRMPLPPQSSDACDARRARWGGRGLSGRVPLRTDTGRGGPTTLISGPASCRDMPNSPRDEGAHAPVVQEARGRRAPGACAPAQALCSVAGSRRGTAPCPPSSLDDDDRWILFTERQRAGNSKFWKRLGARNLCQYHVIPRRLCRLRREPVL